jgi:hypothetical protein
MSILISRRQLGPSCSCTQFGDVRTPTIITFHSPGFTFGYVCLFLGPDQRHTAGRQRESGTNRHTVQWSELRVITNYQWCKCNKCGCVNNKHNSRVN